MPPANTAAVFFERIEKRDDGCWEWVGHRDERYGRFPYRGERWAHRSSYVIHHGPIPEGLEIDHLCRFTFCVNPAHLEAVTRSENVRRAAAARGPAAHGTTARAWAGCRCHPCREAQRAYGRSNRRRAVERFKAGEIEIEHGSNGYVRYGCRCEVCKADHLPKVIAYRRKKGVKPFKEAQHGTVSRYSSEAHKCRCDDCRRAWSEYWKAHRAKRRMQAASA